LLFGATLTTDKVRFVKVLAVEHEDGSGKRFNVTGYTASGEKATVFVTTVD
jgi:hypothetical protein